MCLSLYLRCVYVQLHHSNSYVGKCVYIYKFLVHWLTLTQNCATMVNELNWAYVLNGKDEMLACPLWSHKGQFSFSWIVFTACCKSESHIFLNHWKPPSAAFPWWLMCLWAVSRAYRQHQRSNWGLFVPVVRQHQVSRSMDSPSTRKPVSYSPAVVHVALCGTPTAVTINTITTDIYFESDFLVPCYVSKSFSPYLKDYQNANWCHFF